MDSYFLPNRERVEKEKRRKKRVKKKLKEFLNRKKEEEREEGEELSDLVLEREKVEEIIDLLLAFERVGGANIERLSKHAKNFESVEELEEYVLELVREGVIERSMDRYFVYMRKRRKKR